MSKILSAPRSHLIEKTALQFAAIFWETGKSQGMVSKCKTAREYARKNVERFVPMVIKHFMEMLGNEHLPDLMKREIYEAVMERHNDPTLQTGNELPDIDVKKLIELTRASQGSDATPANLNLINKIEAAVKHKGH